ncbi:hypothetical protein HK098_005268 [Nowakowskiella sp. JEL0407]|nr:hypothetical protein HK098_005268 [Nowakowskiella sp. JEL0407]
MPTKTICKFPECEKDFPSNLDREFCPKHEPAQLLFELKKNMEESSNFRLLVEVLINHYVDYTSKTANIKQPISFEFQSQTYAEGPRTLSMLYYDCKSSGMFDAFLIHVVPRGGCKHSPPARSTSWTERARRAMDSAKTTIEDLKCRAAYLGQQILSSPHISTIKVMDGYGRLVLLLCDYFLDENLPLLERQRRRERLDSLTIELYEIEPIVSAYHKWFFGGIPNIITKRDDILTSPEATSNELVYLNFCAIGNQMDSLEMFLRKQSSDILLSFTRIRKAGKHIQNLKKVVSEDCADRELVKIVSSRGGYCTYLFRRKPAVKEAIVLLEPETEYQTLIRNFRTLYENYFNGNFTSMYQRILELEPQTLSKASWTRWFKTNGVSDKSRKRIHEHFKTFLKFLQNSPEFHL